jgi:hypothetical protein
MNVNDAVGVQVADAQAQVVRLKAKVRDNFAALPETAALPVDGAAYRDLLLDGHYHAVRYTAILGAQPRNRWLP